MRKSDSETSFNKDHRAATTTTGVTATLAFTTTPDPPSSSIPTKPLTDAVQEEDHEWRGFDILKADRIRSHRLLKRIAQAAADAFYTSEEEEDEDDEMEADENDGEKRGSSRRTRSAGEFSEEGGISVHQEDQQRSRHTLQRLSDSGKSIRDAAERRTRSDAPSRVTSTSGTWDPTMKGEDDQPQVTNSTGSIQDDGEGSSSDMRVQNRPSEKQAEPRKKKQEDKKSRTDKSSHQPVRKDQRVPMVRPAETPVRPKKAGAPSNRSTEPSIVPPVESTVDTSEIQQQSTGTSTSHSTLPLVSDLPPLVSHIEVSSALEVLGSVESSSENMYRIVAEVFNYGIDSDGNRVIPSASLSLWRVPVGDRESLVQSSSSLSSSFSSLRNSGCSILQSGASCLWTTQLPSHYCVTHLLLVDGPTEQHKNNKEFERTRETSTEEKKISENELSHCGTLPVHKRLLVIVVTATVTATDSITSTPSSSFVSPGLKSEPASEPTTQLGRVSCSSNHTFTPASASCFSIFDATTGIPFVQHCSLHGLVSRLILPSSSDLLPSAASSHPSWMEGIGFLTTVGLLHFVYLHQLTLSIATVDSTDAKSTMISSYSHQDFSSTSLSSSSLLSSVDLRERCLIQCPTVPSSLTTTLTTGMGVQPSSTSPFFPLLAKIRIHDIHFWASVPRTCSPLFVSLASTRSSPIEQRHCKRNSTEYPIPSNISSSDTTTTTTTPTAQFGLSVPPCCPWSLSRRLPKVIVTLNNGVISGFDPDYGVWDRLDDLNYSHSDFYAYDMCTPSYSETAGLQHRDGVIDGSYAGGSCDVEQTDGQNDGECIKDRCIKDRCTTEWNPLRQLQRQSRSLNYNFKMSVLNQNSLADLGSLLLDFLDSSGLRRHLTDGTGPLTKWDTQVISTPNRSNAALSATDEQRTVLPMSEAQKTQYRQTHDGRPLESSVSVDQSVSSSGHQAPQAPSGSVVTVEHALQQISSAAFLRSANEFLIWLRLLFNRLVEIDSMPPLIQLCDSLLDLVEEEMYRQVERDTAHSQSSDSSRREEPKVGSERIITVGSYQRELHQQKGVTGLQVSDRRRCRETWGDYQGESLQGDRVIEGQHKRPTSSLNGPDAFTGLTSDRMQNEEERNRDEEQGPVWRHCRVKPLPVLRWCTVGIFYDMGLNACRVLLDAGCKTIVGASRWKEFVALLCKESIINDVVDSRWTVRETEEATGRIDTVSKAGPPSSNAASVRSILDENLSSQLSARIFERLKSIETKRLELIERHSQQEETLKYTNDSMTESSHDVVMLTSSKKALTSIDPFEDCF